MDNKTKQLQLNHSTKEYKGGYVCFSLRMARFLLSQGCVIKALSKNTKYPGFIVFIFHDDKRLQTALNRWDYHYDVLLKK